MDAKEYNNIMERLDFIEFRQQLLFDNDDVSRSIFEYGLTREQYKRIMALMQDYRERIERGEKCDHRGFEQAMYEIVPDHRGDYHMCEELAKGFRDENRWEEVFDNLYGEMPKYSYLKSKEEINYVECCLKFSKYCHDCWICNYDLAIICIKKISEKI